MLLLGLRVFVRVFNVDSSFQGQPVKEQLLINLQPIFIVKHAALWLNMVSRTCTRIPLTEHAEPLSRDKELTGQVGCNLLTYRYKHLGLMRRCHFAR